MSIVKSAVVLHGGIGNQLFQWSYGHFLQSRGKKIDFVFLNKEYLIEHTRKSLGNILSDCDHGSFQEKTLSRYKILRVVTDPTSAFNPLHKMKWFLDNSTNYPFSFKNIYSRFHLGYYQNAKMVNQVGQILFDHLLSDLYGEELNPIEKMLCGQEILHIRQGDTKTPQNLMGVGVLDRTYYSSLPSKGDNKRFALTDDMDGAKELLKGLDIDGLFGPDQVDVRSALRIMGNSSSLFTANSTLSWWGGFLAIHRNGRVFIPDPFFRNIEPRTDDAFHFPGFNLLNSSFMEPNPGN